MEIFGFKGFCSPYGMQKTGKKIHMVVKKLLEIPYGVCVLVGKEPVRGSPTKSKE